MAPWRSGACPETDGCVSGKDGRSAIRRVEHRRVELLRQRNARVPTAAPLDLLAIDEGEPFRSRDPLGEFARRSPSGAKRALTVRTAAGPSAGWSQSSSGMDTYTGPAGGCKAKLYRRA